MTKEKMTIHKALAELKILDDRITKLIHNTTFCNAKKHSAEKINGITVDDWKANVDSDYTKVVSLIKRRNAIKKAVVLSNALTKVTINGQEYTVAEAIDMKNHGIELDVLLATKLSDDLKRAVSAIQLNNGDELDRRADVFIAQMYGTKEGKTNNEEIKKSREDFIKASSYELVDPIDVKSIIGSLDDSISKFKAEVDSALSVSNAITEIEIEY